MTRGSASSAERRRDPRQRGRDGLRAVTPTPCPRVAARGPVGGAAGDEREARKALLAQRLGRGKSPELVATAVGEAQAVLLSSDDA